MKPEGFFCTNTTIVTPIRKFSASCNSCGSKNIKLLYEFNYYGGLTGYDQNLSLICQDCSETEEYYI